MNEHVYKAVVYFMGNVEKEIITCDIEEIRKIYTLSIHGNRAVRVWVDGRKLTYGESISLLEKGAAARNVSGR